MPNLQTLVPQESPSHGQAWVCPMRESTGLGVPSALIQLREPRPSGQSHDRCTVSVARKVVGRTKTAWEVTA